MRSSFYNRGAAGSKALALALAAMAALLMRCAADTSMSPDAFTRAGSALFGAFRQVGAILADPLPECQRTPAATASRRCFM